MGDALLLLKGVTIVNGKISNIEELSVPQTSFAGFVRDLEAMNAQTETPQPAQPAEESREAGDGVEEDGQALQPTQQLGSAQAGTVQAFPLREPGRASGEEDPDAAEQLDADAAESEAAPANSESRTRASGDRSFTGWTDAEDGQLIKIIKHKGTGDWEQKSSSWNGPSGQRSANALSARWKGLANNRVESARCIEAQEACTLPCPACAPGGRRKIGHSGRHTTVINDIACAVCEMTDNAENNRRLSKSKSKCTVYCSTSTSPRP